MRKNSKRDLVYYTFEHFERTELVRHAFSTRLGGVSEGSLASLNLGLSRGDDRNNVLANYEIICGEIGIKTENLVLSAQTHTTNLVTATKADRGNGLMRDNAFKDVDGFITNEPETALVTFYADCVPIFILDPVQKAIGLSHAGWRGTLNKIAEVTLNAMKREFGSEPENILAGIGPSIGPCCFETDEPIYSLFEKEVYSKKHVTQKENGKANINLWEINREILVNCGVKPENIELASLCTKCNSEVFYSHRVQAEKRGSLAAIMELKICT